jgi:hypothetical protein
MACMLSLSMACSELYEIASLLDDASNDFTFQAFAGHEQVKSVIAAAKKSREPRRERPETRRPEYSEVAPAVAAPAVADDSLQFSTVLRT